ncbi:competence protein ComK [Amphibacillus marinus]|uniref:Competence protein ComK n=1 Tax=Amphibacillus marinus TaxID=872970 RepID=A0A1H8RVU7_9BACI|nr:competence protein ComK [Amphibacillus marinus]SEO70304.1 competence protein ComK [Amphibacillus marinus]
MVTNVISTYQLSHSTMGITAVNVEGKWYSEIIEENVEEEMIISQPPNKLISQACKMYGEEIISRFDGAKLLCDFSNKAPIAISSAHNIYFFPTESPSRINCSWFSHTHIRSITKADYNNSTLTFRDGKQRVVPFSYGIMHNQVNRTAQYRFILSEQLKHNQQKGVLQMILKAMDLSKYD